MHLSQRPFWERPPADTCVLISFVRTSPEARGSVHALVHLARLLDDAHIPFLVCEANPMRTRSARLPESCVLHDILPLPSPCIQKEAMFNVLMRRAPKRFTKFLLLTPFLIPQTETWAVDASQALDTHDVVEFLPTLVSVSDGQPLPPVPSGGLGMGIRRGIVLWDEGICGGGSQVLGVAAGLLPRISLDVLTCPGARDQAEEWIRDHPLSGTRVDGHALSTWSGWTSLVPVHELVSGFQTLPIARHMTGLWKVTDPDLEENLRIVFLNSNL